MSGYLFCPGRSLPDLLDSLMLHLISDQISKNRFTDFELTKRFTAALSGNVAEVTVLVSSRAAPITVGTHESVLLIL